MKIFNFKKIIEISTQLISDLKGGKNNIVCINLI